MNKPKILIINYEFPPIGGGGGVATYQISKELTKTYEVHILTSGINTNKTKIVYGIKVHQVSITNRKNRSTATLLSMLYFIIKGIIRGVKLCKKQDFIYIWSWFAIPSGIVGHFLSKTIKIPHNLTIIGGDIYDPSKKISPHKHYILRKLINYIINNSKKITAISSDTKKRYHAFYKNKKRKIKVLPLGFIPLAFKKKTRKQLGLEKNTFYFITVGRLVKRKGYKYLIKAFSNIKNKNIKLIFIGDGPEEEKLKQIAKEYNVLSQIIFLGYISEIKKFQYLSCSDCYVLSSLHEGFGIVLQEAMYCNLPIISTNNGGQTDFLKNNINALLVSPSNSKKLSNAMNIILKNKKLREKFAENNKKLIKEFFINKITKQYISFFKK